MSLQKLQDFNQDQILFIDKYSQLLKSDALSRELRTSPGIPNATYVVFEEKVFVFNALKGQVLELLQINPDTDIAKLAVQALLNFNNLF